MNESEDDPDNQIRLKTKADWFEDPLGADLVQYHRVKGRIYSARSAYQSVDIIETGSFGRCLVLDGRIQSCEGDEFIYHESLVQPVMTSHPAPKEVLIAGGGEGATCRHVLMHPSVSKLVMVDIDEEVIRVSREMLPAFSAGSFDDSRFELVVGDARKYVENSGRKFDVILLDLPESLEGGPARFLYTKEFYGAVKRSLRPGGIIASQSDNASWGCMFGFPAIVNTMKAVFPVVRAYQVHIPSFGGSWGFSAASADIDPAAIAAESIDSRLAERRIRGLGFYDGVTHCHLFALPKHLRKTIEQEQRVISDANPLAVKVDFPS